MYGNPAAALLLSIVLLVLVLVQKFNRRAQKMGQYPSRIFRWVCPISIRDLAHVVAHAGPMKAEKPTGPVIPMGSSVYRSESHGQAKVAKAQ